MTPRDETMNSSGAYALHALTGAERAEFEAALAESEQLRTEVTELTDTAVELGMSVAPVEPPASLRASVLAAVAATPQNPAADPVGEPVETSAERRANARWFRRPVVALAGVAAAAVVALAVTFGIGGLNPSDPVAAQIAEIQAASDAQTADVEITGGGTATLVWSLALERSALLVDGMAGLPAGSTYELWYIDADGATPAGTFDPGDDGAHSVVLAGSMDAGDAIGVTVEPEGGSDAPTTDPVLVVQTA